MNDVAVARSVTVVAALVLVAAAGLVGQGAVVGETLASGPGWELKVKSSPVHSSITWEEPRRSGGAGGLARPGLLSEAVHYSPPDTGMTYVAGLRPADATSVWVSADDQEWQQAKVRHVLGAAVYLATIDSGSAVVALETRDEDGQTLERLEQPLVPPPHAGLAPGGR